MRCTADGRPEPSYEIFFNKTILVKSNKTYTIPKVNSHFGYYECVAKNMLGNASSNPVFLSLVGKNAFLIPLI